MRCASSIAGRPATPRVTRIIREGDVIYEPGDFGTSFFTIVNGEVTLQAQEAHAGDHATEARANSSAR